MLELISPLHGVAAFVMMALAALIVALDRRSAIHRAFALFLTLRAVVNFGSGFGVESIAAYDPYLGILLPFAALHFAIVYHRRMRRVHGSLWTIPLVWGYGVLAVVALERHFEWLWGPIGVFGPFQFWMFAVRMLVYGGIGLLLAWDAVRSAPDAHQRSLLFVSLAFVLNPLFVSVGALAHLPDRGIGFLRTPSGVAWLALIPCVAAVSLLVVAAWRSRGGPLRRGVRAWVAVFALCGIASAATIVLAGYDVSAPTYIAMDGAMTLAFPVLVSYALLKHRLFDIDLRVKRTLRGGTVASAFVAVFFVAQEAAEFVIASRTGSALVGIAGAAALAAGLKPLGRMASRLSDAVMPDVEDTPEYARARKLEVYAEAVDALLEDDRVWDKEREILARMRRRLDIGEEDAAEVERRVRLARTLPAPV